MANLSAYDVVIVGAGLSGLQAAIALQAEGLNVKIVEASAEVGGRVASDFMNGYILDRGFQVLLTAYPEARQQLDYDALNMKAYGAGALVNYQNKTYRLADPFRKPITSVRYFSNPFTALFDKVKIVALRNRHRRLSIEQIFEQPEMSTLAFLNDWNFSDKFIESFLKPFLGGIYLEENLDTSSRMFEFVFKMFSEGYAAIPRKGMAAIPQQLASQLAENTVELKSKVAKIEEGKLILESGETLTCRAILLATDAATAANLSEEKINVRSNTVDNLYFSTSLQPYAEPLLYLNGNRNRLINNIAIPTNVHANYAPKDKHLISVSVIKNHGLNATELYKAVTLELRTFFGPETNEWKHLKTYTIEKALPYSATIGYPSINDIKEIRAGVFVAGDHTHDPSINGAMRSGRLAAEAIAWHLSLNMK